MTPEATLGRAARDLDAVGAQWAVVGGLAVSARAAPRLTRDVDLAVAVSSDAEAEALLHALQRVGWQIAVVLDHRVTGRLATARLVHGADRPPVYLDLIFSATGIEQEAVRCSERMRLVEDPGPAVPIARIGHLIAMKVLACADRAKGSDTDDLDALVARADDTETDLARQAIAQIRSAGYDRGHDLVALFDRALQRGETRR